jgi:hypothetical protein
MLISKQDNEALYYHIFKDEKPKNPGGSEQENNNGQKQ